jgi:UDP-N-acetylglucosamine kinase
MGISEDAINYIKKNQKALIEKYASLSVYSPSDNPWAFFMAGCPGAGKTEISKSIIFLNKEIDVNTKIVRIDADEIREFLVPFYKGCNSDEVQRAASLGVQKIFDSVKKHHQNFILDGTFAHYEVSRQNILRCVDSGMRVGIFYVYQDPLIAWEFTKIREKKEGRSVPKTAFIEAYFNAKENVNKIKAEFGKKVTVELIIKDYKNGVEKVVFSIDKIDSFIKNEYNAESLEKLLK